MLSEYQAIMKYCQHWKDLTLITVVGCRLSVISQPFADNG